MASDNFIDPHQAVLVALGQSGESGGVERKGYIHRGDEGHDDFFEGGVAGAFAEAVDRRGERPGTGLVGGESVGCGHAQVVVTVEFNKEVREDMVECGDGGVGLEGIPNTYGVGDAESEGSRVDSRVREVEEEDTSPWASWEMTRYGRSRTLAYG